MYESRRLLRVLGAEAHTPHSAHCSEDGVFVMCMDKHIRVMDVITGLEITEMTMQLLPIKAVKVVPKSSKLILFSDGEAGQTGAAFCVMFVVDYLTGWYNGFEFAEEQGMFHCVSEVVDNNILIGFDSGDDETEQMKCAHMVLPDPSSDWETADFFSTVKQVFTIDDRSFMDISWLHAGKFVVSTASRSRPMTIEFKSYTRGPQAGGRSTWTSEHRRDFDLSTITAATSVDVSVMKLHLVDPLRIICKLGGALMRVDLQLNKIALWVSPEIVGEGMAVCKEWVAFNTTGAMRFMDISTGNDIAVRPFSQQSRCIYMRTAKDCAFVVVVCFVNTALAVDVLYRDEGFGQANASWGQLKPRRIM